MVVEITMNVQTGSIFYVRTFQSNRTMELRQKKLSSQFHTVAFVMFLVYFIFLIYISYLTSCLFFAGVWCTDEFVLSLMYSLLNFVSSFVIQNSLRTHLTI